MSKSRKRRPAKGKLAAKAPMEEWNSAEKTVTEQKPFSHICREFFLLLFSLLCKLYRNLFSFGPSEKRKEPSLSLEGPDAASCSSALATPSGVSVAAKRATEEQTEGPAGIISAKDPCDDPNSTGNSNEALTLGPEDIEAVLSNKPNGKMVGGIVREDRVGYHKKEEAQVNLVGRLHEPTTEDDEIRWKERDDLKKDREVLVESLKLRQAYSEYRETKAFEVMNNDIKKEVLKSLKRKTRNFKMIVRKTSFTQILRAMFVQKAKMSQKESFCDINWRNRNFFPKFNKDDAEYQWWEQNFDLEILEERLDILREAAKKWNSEQDIFLVVQLVTELNCELHPQTSEKDRVEIFRLATTIHSLRSGGDSKI